MKSKVPVIEVSSQYQEHLGKVSAAEGEWCTSVSPTSAGPS